MDLQLLFWDYITWYLRISNGIPGDLKVMGQILKRIVLNFGPWELFDGTLLSLGLDLLNCRVRCSSSVFS